MEFFVKFKEFHRSFSSSFLFIFETGYHCSSKGAVNWCSSCICLLSGGLQVCTTMPRLSFPPSPSPPLPLPLPFLRTRSQRDNLWVLVLSVHRAGPGDGPCCQVWWHAPFPSYWPSALNSQSSYFNLPCWLGL